MHGAPPLPAHDQTLQKAAAKVANRGLGDKLVAWMRNKGLVTTQSPTMQAVRAAITTKAGQDSTQAIFDRLKMGANRSLSDRKITAAIDLANRIEARRQTPLAQAFANLPATGRRRGGCRPAPARAQALTGDHRRTDHQPWTAAPEPSRWSTSWPATSTWKARPSTRTG